MIKSDSDRIVMGSDLHPIKLTAGHGNAIKAIDISLLTMKLGERAIITARDEYALQGKREFLNRKFKIEAGDLSTIILEIEIIRFGREINNKWELFEDDRITLANKLKLEGNEGIKAKNFQLALEKYTSAYQIVERDIGPDFDDLKISLLSNLSLAYLKVDKPEKAIETASSVLDKQPSNVKILYRRAVAYIETRKFQQARDDLNTALKLEPENKEVIAELQLIKEKEKHAKEKEKQFYSRMLK
jgi:FK506-binding protein 4/5